MATDLDKALTTNIAEPIDKNVVSSILAKPPFITIDGVSNCRDVSSNTIASSVRHAYVFRTAMLEDITERGKQDIIDLGVKTIFDLRSKGEIEAHPDPEIQGVEVVCAAVGSITNPADAVKYSTLAEMYMSMLDTHREAWTLILRHVLNHPEQPFLLHCTGGKDRTGVAAALILSLAGESPDDISKEYALSRIGVEPARESLTQKLTGGKAMDLYSERYQTIAKIEATTIVDFLAELSKKHGSVEDYVQDILQFSRIEIETINRNLHSKELK